MSLIHTTLGIYGKGLYKKGVILYGRRYQKVKTEILAGHRKKSLNAQTNKEKNHKQNPEEDIHMCNKYAEEKILASLVIREMQSKARRYHFSLITLASLFFFF